MKYSQLLALMAGLAQLACHGQCELDDDLRTFAGDAARDCGEAGGTDNREAVDACVATAFEAGVAFIARYPRQGEDSQLVTAIAANSAGDVKLLQWDSAPCGGPDCDPVTDVQSCEGPALTGETSEDPNALPISCDSYGPAQRVCG